MESYFVYYEKGIYVYNYVDLFIFDMLFGIFKNFINFVVEIGFYFGVLLRVMDMLMCYDVFVLKEELMFEFKFLG